MAIELNPFRQSPGLCGPASLKILLDYYGRTYTEGELSEICNATAEYGTDHADMVAAVASIGGEPVEKFGASLDDIRGFVDDEIPVIVGWFSEYGGQGDHYSVVYAMDNETLSMMDPERDEGSVTMPLDAFEKVWYDFDGPDDVRVERWMMAVPSFKPTP